MKRKSESLILGPLLRKLGRRIGARVQIEPEWGFVGQITFKSGKRSYFRYNTLDLNPVGASDVAKDKAYATYFMALLGYATVEGRTFFSDDWCAAIRSRRNLDAAYRYARRLGFPVVVKPNSGSQGSEVAFAHTRVQFYAAMKAVFKKDRVALVQRPVEGKDYRLVVLDGRVISAYERVPLHVVGDGSSTIKKLLKEKARRYVAAKRDTRLKMDDVRIDSKLKRQGLSMRSVPALGTRVFLLDHANLSAGGDAIDVTDKVHPAFRKMAIRLTKDMGLRLCGVDLIVQPDIEDAPGKYWVLEINAAPGLDHYAKTGRQQSKLVEALYSQVLRSLAR